MNKLKVSIHIKNVKAKIWKGLSWNTGIIVKKYHFNYLSKFKFLWGNYYSSSWFLLPVKTYSFANNFQTLGKYTLFSTAVFVVYCIKLKFKRMNFNWQKISLENGFSFSKWGFRFCARKYRIKFKKKVVQKVSLFTSKF